MIAIRMAFRSVLRNWRHSLATMISVALGLVSVALIDGFIKDVQKQAAEFIINRSMYGHFIIEKVDLDTNDMWQGLLSKAEAERISQELLHLGDKIVTFTRFFPIQGMAQGASQSLGFFGYAYDIKNGEKARGNEWRRNTLYGRPLQREDEPKVTLGRGFAELLGCEFPASTAKEKDTDTMLECFKTSLELTGLTEQGKMNALEVEIEGVVEIGFRDLEDSWLLMPMEQAHAFYNSEKSAMFGVLLQDERTQVATIDQLKKIFLAAQIPVQIVPWKEHKVAEFYRENALIHDIFRMFVFLIVVVICALSLSNTITRSIIQRTREIGTLRAIGFKQRFISSLFAWEGFFLGLIGSLFGALIALFFAFAINAMELTYVPGFLSQAIPFRIFADVSYCAELGIFLTLMACFLSWLMTLIRTKKGIAASLCYS